MPSETTSLEQTTLSIFEKKDPRDGFAWHPCLPPWYRVSKDGYLEDWYDVVGNTHFYDIPDGKPIILKPRKLSSVRYPRVSVNWRGHRKSQGRNAYDHYIHKLVALCFVPNPRSFKIVRHLDDNPMNYAVSNLAWGNRGHNAADFRDNNPYVHSVESATKLTPDKVKMIRILAAESRVTNVSLTDIARVFGITPRHVGNIVARRCWVHVD